MATRTITRAERGIALAGERGEEFERVKAFTWRVPAAGLPYPYTVNLDLECCTCDDFQIRHDRDKADGYRDTLPCKHIYAAEIVAAKRRKRNA